MKSILSFLLHYPFTQWSLWRLSEDLSVTFDEMAIIEQAINSHMAVNGWESALIDLHRDLDDLKRRYEVLTEERDAIEDRYEQRRIAAICALEGKQHNCSNDE